MGTAGAADGTDVAATAAEFDGTGVRGGEWICGGVSESADESVDMGTATFFASLCSSSKWGRFRTGAAALAGAFPFASPPSCSRN